MQKKAENLEINWRKKIVIAGKLTKLRKNVQGESDVQIITKTSQEKIQKVCKLFITKRAKFSKK